MIPDTQARRFDEDGQYLMLYQIAFQQLAYYIENASPLSAHAIIKCISSNTIYAEGQHDTAEYFEYLTDSFVTLRDLFTFNSVFSNPCPCNPRAQNQISEKMMVIEVDMEETEINLNLKINLKLSEIGIQ